MSSTPGAPPPLYNAAPPPPVPPARRQGQRGLAIATLLLGIGAVLLSPLLIGSVLGVIGIVLAIIYFLDRKPPYVSALAGAVLSLVGIGLSVYFAQFYFGAMQQFVQKTVAQAQEDLSHWEELEAPDFAARTLENDALALSQWRGEPVIVLAWGMFPPGMDAFSGEKLGESVAPLITWYNANRDTYVLGVSPGWPEELLQRLVDETGATFPNAIVEDLPSPYNRAVFPTVFLIDREGNFSAIEKLPVSTGLLDAHVTATPTDETALDDTTTTETQPSPEAEPVPE